MLMHTYPSSYKEALQNKDIRTHVIAITKHRRNYLNIILILCIALAISAALLLAPLGWLWAIPAVLLATQAKLWAWYLAHDCAHNAALSSRSANRWLGETCSFINGLGMFSFNDYKKDHNRHHAEKVDLLGVKTECLLAKLPRRLANSVMFAERLYIPAMNYTVFISSIADSLHTKAGRRKSLAVITLYLIFYMALFTWSFTAVLVWLASSCLRIHVVRFVDCFQHAYEQIDANRPSSEKRSQHYEIAHTFSIPVAKKYTCLNLIILNFGYHNAHHMLPTCPWYALPQTDQLILQGMGISRAESTTREDQLSFSSLLLQYHRNLEPRITSNYQGYPYNDKGEFSLSQFHGAYTDNLLG